jgi:hypothetical protein
MANFSVIAKNNKLEQTNNIDDLQYAFEMYKYLAFEMDFPDVKLIDNETAEVLLYIKRETTSYEYISPLLMRAFQEGEENADTPIEPSGVNEETALRADCMELIEKLVAVAPRELADNVMKIYTRLEQGEYDIGTLKHLKKVLEEISKNY